MTLVAKKFHYNLELASNNVIEEDSVQLFSKN